MGWASRPSRKDGRDAHPTRTIKTVSLEKPKIFLKTGFLALWLRKSHRLSESVVVYSSGRVNKVARKNAVNCPGD
ncbi:MAG: hypothetical protein EAZ93_11855 [Oscillatoriales cyanobacterium]|nr:MAG: hypothetical protein EAZ93_11855 [Oscillatoriales cyanobacterium]